MGQKEFVTAEGLRRDGRRAKELRRIKCQVGVLQSADGSAMFEVGNTQVGGALVDSDMWNLMCVRRLSRLPGCYLALGPAAAVTAAAGGSDLCVCGMYPAGAGISVWPT
jgi:hypothetical protein